MARRTFLRLVGIGVFGGLAHLWAWAPVEIPGLRYPRAAQLARLEGVIVVECTIDEDGGVSKAVVKSGHPVLATAAAKSARTWRFKRSGGDHHAPVVPLTFEFRLVGTCKSQYCEEKFLLRYGSVKNFV
jgi:TonB family protein